MLGSQVSRAIGTSRLLPPALVRHASRQTLTKSSSDDIPPLSIVSASPWIQLISISSDSFIHCGQQVDTETFRTLPRHELSLIGNLGKDLEVRKTPAGKDVASGTLAVNASDQAGGESTTWWKLTFWGDAALSASAAVSKGTKVLVKGPAFINSYTTASGEIRETLELTVKEMSIVQKKKE